MAITVDGLHYYRNKCQVWIDKLEHFVIMQDNEIVRIKQERGYPKWEGGTCVFKGAIPRGNVIATYLRAPDTNIVYSRVDFDKPKHSNYMTYTLTLWDD